MKKIIIVLAMVLAGVAMYAQEPQVLVLKDGTVIKGEVEKLPDGGARVTNEYGDIFEYTAEEVSYAGEKLSEKQMKKQRKAAALTRDYAAPMKGYKLFLDTGLAAGVISYYHPYNSYNGSNYVLEFAPLVMLNVINGYSFSQYLYVGGGVGINLVYIPVYAHVRSSFLKKRVSPFVSASAGVSIGIIESAYTGLYLDGGFGICVKKKRKGEVWISLNGEINANWTGAALKVGYSF